jgi:LmbE family N-acetylglucosaminyl deacetylase
MNILAFFAHPDDETILAGGTLALLAAQGARVHYLCATRGEGGEVGEPPLCEPAELGQVREGELVCAVQALGGHSLTFLGYIDPRVGPDEELYPFADDETTLAGQVALSLRQHEAGALITHGSNGEYGHPAHVLCHRAALAAARSVDGAGPALYTVGASFDGHPRPRLANQDDPADLVVDVSAVFEVKEAAARCHRTQNALFVRRSSQEAGRQLDLSEVLMRLEGLRRVPHSTQKTPDGPLEGVLERSGALV